MYARFDAARCQPIRRVADILTIIAVAVLAGSATVTAQTPVNRPPVPGAPAQPTAFVNATIVPMDSNRVLPGHTVLVQNGWITALGPSDLVSVPAGAHRIEGAGKYLMPGLGDCHTHMSYTLPPGVPADSAVEDRLFVWLSTGVTTIRNMDYMNADGKVWGLDGEDRLRFRARATAGEFWSPRIYTAGQWAPKQYTHSSARHKLPGLPAPRLDSVPAYIAAYKAAGYDFLKVHEESPEVFEAILAAARQLAMPVVGHPKGEHDAALSGMQSIEHMVGYPRDSTSPHEIEELVEATKKAGVWNCPTLGMGGSSHLRLIKMLHDSGARLLLGTDLGPISAELEKMVELVGLTPYQALVLGTRNIAAYFNALDVSGTIAAGKRADLVLLDGNPLADIARTAKPAGVMIGGRWLAREVFEPRAAAVRAMYRRRP